MNMTSLLVMGSSLQLLVDLVLVSCHQLSVFDFDWMQGLTNTLNQKCFMLNHMQEE